MKRLVYILCIGSRRVRFMSITVLIRHPVPSCHSCDQRNLLYLMATEVALLTRVPICDAVATS
jgi:hypothetical protein